MGYCNRSAAPVGRYLIDLHGESPAGLSRNPMRSATHCRCSITCRTCREDYKALDRVYLPQDWMAEAGIGSRN